MKSQKVWVNYHCDCKLMFLFLNQRLIPVQVFSIYTHVQHILINSPDKANKATCLVRENKEIPHSVRAALALQSRVPSCNKHTHTQTKWRCCKFLSASMLRQIEVTGNERVLVPIFLNQLASSVRCSVVMWDWCETVCRAAVMANETFEGYDAQQTP